MHPILFHLWSFYVGTYGVMISLGLIAAIGLAVRLARRQGLPPDFFYDLAFVAAVSGFLGARALFILLNLQEFAQHPLDMLLDRTGFVFLGGFAAAVPASIWYVRRHQLPIWAVSDVSAPCLSLAHGFGRIGCFFAGCCYGRVCSEGSHWGVRFPHLLDAQGKTIFSMAWHEHVTRGLIDPEALASAPVLPTQLFESATNFLICGALLLLWRRRKFEGEVFVAYLALYGAARFMLEFLRGDAERGVFSLGPFALSTSQFISLAAIAASAVLWRKLPAKTAPSPAPAKKARAAR